MFKQLFWPKIFTPSTLCVNVYKMPYHNVKSFKKSNFWEFWAIDKTLDKFYYPHYHK
jgi:hypothetical protein